MPNEQYNQVPPSAPQGAPGQKVPEPKPGDVLRRSFLSRIIRKLNAWQEATIQWGSKDQVHYGDSSVVIELNKNATANSPGGGGGGTSYFLLQGVFDDYVTGLSWDGTALGASLVYIAKPEKLRTSLGSETKFGVPYSYGYAPFSSLGFGPTYVDTTNTAGNSNNLIRTSTNGADGTTEQEIVTPVWLVGDLIAATQVDKVPGIVGGDGNFVTLQMLEDNRHWASVIASVQGLPVGGAAGQVLAKASVVNYDTSWIDNTGANASTTAYTALQTAWSGTSGVNEVFPIAVAGTNLAKAAYSLAAIGTNVGTNALVLAAQGSNLAWEAYTIAVQGTINDSLHDVPAGGATGQSLTKNSATDYDIAWTTVSGGGGSSTPDMTQIEVFL